jgi:hypothetical protein
MPFWRPPKVEDLAREICAGNGKDPDTLVRVLDEYSPAWRQFEFQARQMIALYAQELLGKNVPIPVKILQINARPHAIALEFRSTAQADAFARVLQALKLRDDVTAGDAQGTADGQAGDEDGAAPDDVRLPKAN